MVQSSELDYRTILTDGRNGKVGSACVVLLPRGDSRDTNVPGPILEWQIDIIALSQDDLVLGPQGSGINSEQIAQYVMDAIHQDCDQLYGTLFVAARAMQDEKEYTFPGCLAYRVSTRLSAGRSLQTARVSPVTCTINNHVATLTCPTPSAIIRYSVDGTFPAATWAGTSTALTYSYPFSAVSGTVIRAAAYLANFNKGQTLYFVVP